MSVSQLWPLSLEGYVEIQNLYRGPGVTFLVAFEPLSNKKAQLTLDRPFVFIGAAFKNFDTTYRHNLWHLSHLLREISRVQMQQKIRYCVWEKLFEEF